MRPDVVEEPESLLGGVEHVALVAVHDLDPDGDTFALGHRGLVPPEHAAEIVAAEFERRIESGEPLTAWA
jgi:hypothetical protein